MYMVFILAFTNGRNKHKNPTFPDNIITVNH